MEIYDLLQYLPWVFLFPVKYDKWRVGHERPNFFCTVCLQFMERTDIILYFAVLRQRSI
jgi:hypothetical protein